MDIYNKSIFTLIYLVFTIITQSSSKSFISDSNVLQLDDDNNFNTGYRFVRSPSFSVYFNNLIRGQDHLSTDNDDIKLNHPALGLAEVKTSITNDSQKYTKLGGHLAKIGDGYYYIQTKNKVNFFEANQICKHHGLELVSIESENEDKKLVSYVTEMYPLVDSFWTSGNDLAREGNFVWLSTNKPFTHASWRPGRGPGQPNSVNQNCVVMWSINRLPMDWNNGPCATKYAFICEYME